jgi:hypothetical protein
MRIEPDFTYTSENPDAAIHFIHKRSADLEYYFVTNHRRRAENIQCSLRQHLIQPEIWDTQTGGRYFAPLFEHREGRTDIALRLEAAGALFIVCRKTQSIKGPVTLYRDGEAIYHTRPYVKDYPGILSSIQNNFTVHLWVKPDSFAQSRKSMLFHPADGAEVYGKGHASMGLSAGQNTVKVYERNGADTNEILSANVVLSGWTHIAVAYDRGTPNIFVNGKKVASAAMPSGKNVHPGLYTPASQDQYTSYFEGNNSKPELLRECLPADAILQLYLKGRPAPVLNKNIELNQKNPDRLAALIWQNGRYTLKTNGTQKLLAKVDRCSAAAVTGPWELRFPSGSGAPPRTVWNELGSLHRHEDFNIRYFSGTLTYHKIILISPSDLEPDKRLFLNLGRVEVIAEVKLNGKLLGLLWKEPFLIDITHAVATGNNDLEISVTTLWTNRLIGDEHLPPENNYSKDGPVEELPAWVIQNLPNPGPRQTFSVWHNLEKNSPLLESGLLGPVTLHTAIYKQIHQI